MRLILILTLSLLTFTLTHAQETTPEPASGWTIEQRCVGEPTTPPDDWTYEGTILMRGWAGIHGLTADWDTSRVLAFTNVGEERISTYYGTLSPDSQWFAAIEFTWSCANACNITWIYVSGIQVFNVSGNEPREHYSLDWRLFFSDDLDEWDEPRIVWLDNEHLIFPKDVDPYSYDDTQTWVANPFTGEMSEWAGSRDLFCQYCSQDSTRNLTDDPLNADAPYHLVDVSSQEDIASYDKSSFRRLPNYIPSWSPDSEHFLLLNRINDDSEALTLYNRDGTAIAPIIRLSDTIVRAYPGNALFRLWWAPNSEQFLLLLPTDLNSPGIDLEVYMVDLQEQRITKPCFYIRNNQPWNVEWSPDTEQIAIQDQGQIYIFDLNLWQLFDIQFHFDSYFLSWRADD